MFLGGYVLPAFGAFALILIIVVLARLATKGLDGGGRTNFRGKYGD